MKKTLAMLLALVMLLGLCACGEDDSQTTDPSSVSQATTEGTENTAGSTEGTTDATQATTETPTTTPSTSATTCSHSYKDATCTTPKTCTKCGETEGDAAGHSWNAATCTAPKTCSACGATEGGVGDHSYQNGICTGCGDEEVITHLFGTDTGYAITVSSGEVICYQISDSEVLYDLCTTEKPAYGYYKFREHNGTTYYSPAPSWGWLGVSSYTISGRTVRLEFESETMELELISTNQYKVTKGVESVPAGLVFTFGTDMCSFMGHCSDVRCEGDVTCMYCNQIVCQGLGHEYGEDGVCFRCFAAMRPSDLSDGE